MSKEQLFDECLKSISETHSHTQIHHGGNTFRTSHNRLKPTVTRSRNPSLFRGRQKGRIYRRNMTCLLTCVLSLSTSRLNSLRNRQESFIKRSPSTKGLTLCPVICIRMPKMHTVDQLDPTVQPTDQPTDRPTDNTENVMRILLNLMMCYVLCERPGHGVPVDRLNGTGTGTILLALPLPSSSIECI